jgi:hypothetical protein
MAELVWDQVGERIYETGLDRGVLYLPDGSAVPWNGLTAVTENFDRESNPVYFDGMKINDLVAIGTFSATMGSHENRPGLFYADQAPKHFDLCYRTLVGNDVEGQTAGYKLHVVYNVTAIPDGKEYATLSDDISATEFQWTLIAIPEEVPNMRPTAHFVIDSTRFDPLLLEELEGILYGTELVDASLPSLADLIEFVTAWKRIEILDNGDGTWTANTELPGVIIFGLDGYFEMNQANADFLDADTYVLSDTYDISQGV